MKLVKLTIFEFDEFSKNHPLGSYHQTSNYAITASEEGYDYELLGLKDEDNNLVAASLILLKKMGLFFKYGYAPKGFLIDYYNKELLRTFTNEIKKYYYKKNVAFIKINPEITIGEIDLKTHITTYNKNLEIENTLKELNYKKLIDDTQFSSKIPKYNVIIPLKNSTYNKYQKHTRNKINKSNKLGLELVPSDRNGLDIMYKFIKNKKNYPINHYYNYYNSFSKNNDIDIFLVKINYEKSLINAKNIYEKEIENNNKIVEKVMHNPTEELLKRKLDSDNILNTYKNNITELTRYLANSEECYIAGAITIKYKNRVNILISGYDKKYSSYAPNYFLHNELINYYKNDYDFLDINGISGNFTKDNPYKGLDEFKIGFKPIGLENIGEFDLIINEGLYLNLDKNGILAKEFKRKQKKSIK